MLFNFISITYGDVVTSIRPLGFIASAIANGVTNTKILIPYGVSPHDYSLKPSDIKKIKTADFLIWIGSDMETFLQKPLEYLPSEKVITLSEDSSIKDLLLKSSDSSNVENKKDFQLHHYDNSKYNMHIWLSPDIALIIANIIHNRLVDLYPKYKKQLGINLSRFDDKLIKTDKNIAKILKSVKDRKYFVFHDAYGYFEKRYKLASLGYFTINPIIKPSAKRLYEIRLMLIQKKAVCVFVEPQFRTTIIKNTDVRMVTLDPLGNDIALNKGSYMEFLKTLSNQFKSCLDKK